MLGSRQACRNQHTHFTRWHEQVRHLEAPACRIQVISTPSQKEAQGPASLPGDEAARIADFTSLCVRSSPATRASASAARAAGKLCDRTSRITLPYPPTARPQGRKSVPREPPEPPPVFVSQTSRAAPKADPHQPCVRRLHRMPRRAMRPCAAKHFAHLQPTGKRREDMVA